MDIIKVIILGIIQGLTEWLPISSTAHLLLFNEFFPLLPEDFFNVFLVVVQFGSILAVLLVYWKKLWPFASKVKSKQQQSLRLWTKVIVACIPAAILGFFLDDLIEAYLSGPYIIALTLILYGLVFIWISRNPLQPDVKKLDEISYMAALKIGFYQCLALIPGTSRSGATIIGGLNEGLSRRVASEFSFFVAIPVMAGASLLRVTKYMIASGFFSFYEVMLLFLGTLVSFVVSIFTLKAMINYVRTHSFAIFGWYRIALGILIVITFFFI